MSLNQRRIMIVGPIPPPYGGIARYVQDLLRSELACRYELVHFNTSFSERVRSHDVNPGHRRYEEGRKRKWSKYSYLFDKGFGAGLRTLFAGTASVLRMGSQAARKRPQIVHIFANMHWGFWRAGTMVLLARLVGCKVVFHPLGAIEQFYPSCGSAGKWLIRFMLNRSTLILVQSPGLATQVQPLTTRPVRGVFNGIDLTPFRFMGETARVANGTAVAPGPVFLAIGDLGHNKGTWDILKAAVDVRAQFPHAEFRFIGRGEIGELEDRARQQGVADAVRFLGTIDDEAKYGAMNSADVFLLPSYAEGQPLSILEAMAAGLPVISTPVGSISEVVKDGENGLLVAPGDTQALAAAMVKMAGDQSLRAAMAARNQVDARERFSAGRLWKDLAEFWDRVGNGRAA